MSRTVVIMQPAYIPWLGFFELMLQADVFVFLDTVQYVHQEWNNRNRLKGANGKPFWLTIPVKKHGLNTAIKDILINQQVVNWNRKHLQAIRSNLGGTRFFSNYFTQLEQWYLHPQQSLTSFNIDCIKMIAHWLELTPEFHLASTLNLQGKRTHLLKNICLSLGATHYYSPKGAAAYLEDERYLLENAGIHVAYQEWHHPIYKQKYGHFLSHLSILDALFNIGPQKCHKMLSTENPEEEPDPLNHKGVS